MPWLGEAVTVTAAPGGNAWALTMAESSGMSSNLASPTRRFSAAR